MTDFPLAVDTVVLDVDGTLVDSNYHHTLAWWHAFREVGHGVPAWRIHRSIGMGGDRLVGAVAGDEVEEELGEEIRAAWERRVDAALDDIRPFAGAHELLTDLEELGVAVALASSGIPRHTEHSLDALQAHGHVSSATTSEDAEESKPHPELVQVALEDVDALRAVMIGDSVWDVRSASRAGVPVIGLLCGGFSRAELEDEGAVAVCEDVPDLRGRLLELVTGDR